MDIINKIQMFEKYLEKLIKQKLGAFLDGMDQNQIQFGMSEANLMLNNVKLKQDALLKLNMPVKIELGEIKHLDVRIPWLKIGSKPVEIKIEGLNIILSLQKRQDWKVLNIFDKEYLEQVLASHIAAAEAELAADDSQGYFSKLAIKVLDNIQVRISDIHVRFEDHFSSIDQSYSFGLTLKRFDIHSTNENWVSSFVDRTAQGANQSLFKMVVIEGLAIYLNTNDRMIIHQQTSNMDKRLSILEAISTDEKKPLLQYLLKPMGLTLKVENQYRGGKKMNASVSLECLHLTFLQSQLHCLAKFVEVASDFRKVQNQLYKTKKFKFLRPQSGPVTKINAKECWKFAFQCIKRNNRAKNGSINEFKLKKTALDVYQKELQVLTTKYKSKKDGAIAITVKDKDAATFIHIMSSVDNGVIKEWTKAWARPIAQSKPKSSKGFTSWLLGNSKEDEKQEIMSEQEAAALDQEIESIPDYNPASTTMILSITIQEILFDIGTHNQFNIIEGIRIFSNRTSIDFKQLPTQDLKFDLNGAINDFGVVLYQLNPLNLDYTVQDSVLVSNKKLFKAGTEDQWKISVRKQPEDLRNIEFDIELTADPLLFIYNKEFVRRAILISQIGANEETQNAAIDKIEDIREATSNQIYSIIYKKANRFRVNIASPVIILPVSATSDPNMPIWVLRLGDFHIQSIEQDMSTSVIEYERFQLLIDSIRMQYFTTFSHWSQNLEKFHTTLRERTLVFEKDEQVFTLLEDCWVNFDIGIKQKKAGLLILTSEQQQEHQLKPKVLLSVTTSDIKVNLTHSVFNKVVNIGLIFDHSNDEFIYKPREIEHIESKQTVMKNAIKIGQVYRKLEQLNQWENFYCVLSGGYLYFYKDNTQVMPASYYYLKGSNLVENSQQITVPHNIMLSNRFGDCLIAVGNELALREWSSKIKDKLYDIQMHEEQEFTTLQSNTKAGLKKKKINHQTIQTQLTLHVSNFQTLIFDEIQNSKHWVMLTITDLTVVNQMKKMQSEMTLIMNDLSLIDLTMQFNSKLLGRKTLTQADTDMLTVKIANIEKKSPYYKQIDSQIEVIMEDMIINFQPESINAVIKFTKNTKPGCSYNLIKQSTFVASQVQNNTSSIFEGSQRDMSINTHHFESNLSNGQVASIDLSKQSICQVSCRNIKETLMKCMVVMKNVSLSLLHPSENMQLYRLDSSQIEIDYIEMYDHMSFGTRFRDAAIYDLTGYPYTINPKEYSKNPGNFILKEQILGQMKLPNEENQYALNVDFETYDATCVKKKKGYQSKLNMQIKPMTIEFFNEGFMRFFFYLFEQFFPSLTNADPYTDPLKEEFENIKRRNTMRKDTVKKMIDFKQDTEIFEMDVRISEFSIHIPDRPGSKNQLSLTIKEFTVSQHIHQQPGRIQLSKEKELYIKSFRMNAEGIQFIFSPDTSLTEHPFNIKIVFESLAYSPLLSKIDPKVLDQATHIRIKFDPFQLTIRQDIYTKILRILDLNINFTDFLEREYYFFKYVEMDEYFKTIPNIVGMRIKIDFSCMAIRLEHIDRSFLSELMLVNMVLKMIKYKDYKNVMDIKIQNFFIFDRKQQINLNSLQNMNEIQKLVQSEDCVIQPKADQQKKTSDDIFRGEAAQKRVDQQVIVQVIMKPDGEKLTNVEISGLRITIKPHVLMMVYYFMLNSWPEYDPNSIDKPSFIDFDPENAPHQELSVDTKDCLIVFQNRPGLKTLVCKGRIMFDMISQNIKVVKKYLEEGDGLHNKPNIKEELLLRNLTQDGMNFIEEQQQEEILEGKNNRASVTGQQEKLRNDIAYSMRIKVEDFCPFVCSINQLNENKGFANLTKRQLMNPFNITYLTTYHMIRYQKHTGRKGKQDIFQFGIQELQEISINKIKAKISLQDMHLLFQIVTYANQNVTNEYIKKLEKVDKYIKQQREIKEEEVKQQAIEKFDRRQTLKQDFGIVIEEAEEFSPEVIQQQDEIQEEDYEQEKDNFAEIVNQQYEQTIASQVQRFRSTTRAFQKIAHKYTIVSLGRGKVKKNLKQSGHSAATEERKSVTPTNANGKKITLVDSSLSGIAANRSRLTLANPYSKSNLLISPRANSRVIDEQQPTLNQVEEDNLDEFEDARSELFYTVKGSEEQQFNRKALSQRKETTLEKISEAELKHSQENIDVQFQPNSASNLTQSNSQIVYSNVMTNIISQEWSYSTAGIQIIFINDYDNVFCPVIDFDIPEFVMHSNNENNTSSTNLSLQKVKIHYFNALIGDWEPFLENFNVDYELIESESVNLSKQSFVNISFPRPININLTEQGLQNFIETYYSWMETPPYQFDDYKNSGRADSIQMAIKVQRNSINERDAEKALKSSGNTGSINDDPPQILDEESDTSSVQQLEENLAEAQSKMLNNENFNKVSPYSIKNLSGYAFKVISSGKANRFENDGDDNRRLTDSPRKSGQYVRLSVLVNDFIDVPTNKQVDYSVDLDKESNNFLVQGNRKNNGQGSKANQSLKNRGSTAFTIEQMNGGAAPPEIKKRYKNEELVTIIFDNYEDIKDIDLNKIAVENIELVNRQGIDNYLSIVSFSNQAQQEGIIRHGSSIIPLNIDEQTMRKLTKAQKRKSKIAPKMNEKLRYGVILNKMRKVLTIRQEYIIENQTLFDFAIRISHTQDSNYFKEYQVKQGTQFGLNSQYYWNYNIQLRILSKNDNIEGPQLEEFKSEEFTDGLSTPFKISDIISLSLDQGRIVTHNQNLHSYLKKVVGPFSETYDFVLQPTVTIQNNLPCGLEVMADDADNSTEGEIFKFDKEDQKHFHIFESKKGELHLKFKVAGYVWTTVAIKKKGNNEYEDKETEIKDINGSSIRICIRVQHSKADFQLIFYAYTVIINQSSFQLTYFYNIINKQILAGQEQRREFCIANKDDSIIASISNSNRYSKGLNIKNPGITDSFPVYIAHANVSHDEEATIVKSQKIGMLSSFMQSERKYEFVYQTYMSLVSQQESIYTKIVCIAPKYVIINKISRAISVAQQGNELAYDVIEPNERREWIWQDSNQSDYILVKKENEDLDRDWEFADRIKQGKKAVKWLWSEPINVAEKGIMTIAIKREELRFNNSKGFDIVKVVRKQVDGTTYIVFEEDDLQYPLHRIENLTSNLAIWVHQKNQRFEDEALQLLPMTCIPYAYIDPKQSNQEIEVFFTFDLKETLKRNLGESVSLQFENLGLRQFVEHEEHKFYVSVKTDGCTKIIRVSDRNVQEEEKAAKQILSSQNAKLTKDVTSLSETMPMKETKTVKINVNEVLISFVTRITEREDNYIRSVRKEIAIITIQNILLDKFSSTEEHVDNNKIQIKSIQIDNQSSSNPLFPTILQPRLFKHNEKTPMIDIDINFKTDNPEITFIDSLDFKFSGMVIKFDDRFLGYAINFANELMDQLKTNLTGIHPIFKVSEASIIVTGNADHEEDKDLAFFQTNNEGKEKYKQERKDTANFGAREGVKSVDQNRKTKEVTTQQFERHSNRSDSIKSSQNSEKPDDDQQVYEQYKNWKLKKIDGNSKRIFIKECKLSSLNLEISFLARRSMSHMTKTSNIQSSLNSWGLTLINIDQAPIKVNHFYQKQIFGLQEDITQIISTHYQDSLKKNILKLVGSSELLGNPTKFLTTIGNGLRDFKNMPMKRARQDGVKGFMTGALFGTVSLMKNSVEGTFGFAQSFSGQMSKLLLVATQDDDYLGTREEKLLTEKPRDLVEGVGFGCQTAVDSLKSGVFGIITRPYVGASREGAWGFVKGVYSGSAGFFLKPMSGGLDLISKSTEGIKNTVKIFEAQLFKDRRRLPRTFYGCEEQIKTYNDMDSYIILRILETLDGPFKKDHYIETVKFKDSDRTRFMVLSEEHLILLDAAQKTLKWYVGSKSIQEIQKFQNGLMIQLSEQQHGKWQVPIEINNPAILQRVFDKLKPLEHVQN